MNNSVEKRRKKKITGFDLCVVLILCTWALLIIYPFYNSILVSITSQADYARTPFMLFPKNIDLTAYKYVFESDAIWGGFKVTLIIVVVGVIYSMFLTTFTAYALSKRSFPGKGLVLNLIIITMYFSGGLIPYYLLIKNLHLINNIGSMIVGSGINTFYMLIMRNYFNSIPDSLEESAKIDGANDITILARVILPLSLPVIVTIGLFFTVDKWNEWFNGMLFIRDSNMLPLQAVLRNIISDVNTLAIGGVPPASTKGVFPDGIKMASILITMLPIMCIYPFVQRYFMKGMMLGAIKE